MHRHHPLMSSLLLAAALLSASACEQKHAATAAPPAPAAATSAAADKVATDQYAVALAAGPASGTLTITARPPLHINPDYPAAFRPDPGGVTFAGEKVPLAQEKKTPCAAKASDTCESTSTLAYSGGAPGQRVSGTVQFSVCEPEKCLIEKVKLTSAIP